MEGQVRGGPEAEDQEKKRWWTELCQLDNIILVMAPTCDLDIFTVATLRTESAQCVAACPWRLVVLRSKPYPLQISKLVDHRILGVVETKRRAEHQKSKNAVSTADGQTIAKSRRETARQYGNNNARGSYGLNAIFQRTPSRESDMFQCFPLFLLCNRSSAGRSRLLEQGEKTL